MNRVYLKDTAFVAFSAITKLIYGIVLLKIIAVSVTVKEFGYYGQIIAFFSIMVMLSGLILQNGLVKHLSPLAKATSSAEYAAYINAALLLVLGISLSIAVIAIIVIVYNKQIILPADASNELLYLAIFMQFPAALSTWQLAINNSHKKPKSLFIATLLASMLIVALLVVMSDINLFEFTFLSLFYHFIFLVLITISNIKDGVFDPFKVFSLNLPLKELKKLSGFIFIGLASFLSIQTAQILLRSRLGDVVGWDAVGEWQVILRISDLSLFFVTMFFSAVLYPSISSAKSLKEIVKEYIEFFKIIYLPIIFGLLFVFLLKEHVILFLFDDRYLGAEMFVGPTLLGDAFRIASYAIALLLLLKGPVLLNVSVQFFQFSIYYIIAYFSTDYGLVGLSWAYPISYFIYLIVVSPLAYHLLKKQ